MHSVLFIHKSRGITMTYVHTLIRKIVMMLFAFVIGGSQIPIYAAIKPVQINDVCIQHMVQADGDDVKYENGKLMLHVHHNSNARMDYAGAAVWVVLAIASCGASLMCGVDGAREFYRGDREEGAKSLLKMVFLGGAGLAFGLMFAECYKTIKAVLEERNIPYITFDSDGLAYMGRACLQWSDIECIKTVANDISISSSLTPDTCCETRTLNLVAEAAVKRTVFFDKNGNLLFWLPENDPKCPLSTAAFLTLVEHYISLYGKKQMDGASMPHAQSKPA
jgi:hypothetical protein